MPLHLCIYMRQGCGMISGMIKEGITTQVKA